jgi:gliding motility-associated-like protein
MKKLVLFIFFLGFSFLSKATHIVGGEIELIKLTNVSGSTHRLSLNLYFDELNGNVQAEDATIKLGIFSKVGNVFIGYAILPRVISQTIPFTNPSCVSNNSVRTKYIRYSTDIVLGSIEFGDPGGYYIVWERCCRNNIINNIRNPQSAASVFYLEFPPVTQINSSPIFSTLKGDYICINQPFVFDFGATDGDGDSLVYSLVTPLNGFATSVAPNPDLPQGSSNYPEITWLAGYGPNNAIQGRQPLRVDRKTGVLTVTAGQLGLYVFCVLTEEYRKGKKIGAVRRDFQLKVIECPINNAPKVVLREKNKTVDYKPTEIITIKQSELKKCVTLKITDLNIRQKVNVKIQPVNFTNPNFTITPNQATILSSADTLRADLCFGECLDSFDGKPLIFNVIAFDDGCPQPLYDTLKVQVLVEPLPNQKPEVSTDLPSPKASTDIGKTLKFNVLGNDKDNDEIKIEAKGRGFNLSSAGMNFSGASGKGKITSPFTWTPVCAGVRKDDYIIDFIITDTRCGRNLKDSISVTLKATPIPSKPPVISSSLSKQNRVFEIILDGTDKQTIKFDMFGKDPDNDPILLYARGLGFDIKTVGMNWTDKNGIGTVSSPFAWDIDCSTLGKKDEQVFIVKFTTEDNSCNPDRFDTLSVKFIVKNKIINYDFKPSNVITPNGDGKNDFFTIGNLPENNCFEKFESIEINNRWGQEVFTSQDRKFQWGAENNSIGLYYYFIKFTSRSFKGWIEVLR